MPAKNACRLYTARWEVGQAPAELRFDGTSRPFARVQRGHATVTLARPSTSGAAVEIEVEGIQLKGVIAADSLALHATRVLAFDGFVVPRSHATLRWRASTADELEVAYTLPKATADSRRQPAAGSAMELTRAVSCRDVSLSYQEFFTHTQWEQEGIPLPNTRDWESVEWVNKTVAIRRTAKEPPRAALEVGRSYSALAFEEKQGLRRVLWGRDDEVIFGWVDVAAIGPLWDGKGPHRVRSGVHHPGAGGPASSRAAGTMLTCQKGLALYAVVDGKRRRVGTIAPRTPFYRSAQRNGFVPIVLENPSVTTLEGSQLMLRAAPARRCRPPG